MSDDNLENIIDLSVERVRRVHDQNEKRLQSVRSAFVNALPFANAKPRSKKKAKKKP